MAIYFEAKSKLGIQIIFTEDYWRKIIEIKHPLMTGREAEVRQTLIGPDEIRRSKVDPSVHLYYRKTLKNYLCVVAKQQGSKGFIITTYVTNKTKEGEQVWTR